MEKKSCFIIMPFSRAKGPEGDLNEGTLNYIYEHIIFKALSEYKIKNKKIFGEISRYNAKVGSIINGIIRNLNDSDLVIADLTGLNHNVMYELGVRHTLKRGTIIITQDISSIPSDLRDYLCVAYKYSNSTIDQTTNYNQFKDVLHQAITEIFQTEKFDSPVLNYLKGKEKYWKEDEFKELKENVIVAKYIFQNFNGLSSIVDNIAKNNATYSLNLINSLISNIGSGLNDLALPIEDSNLYESLQTAKTMIGEVNKKAFITDYFGDIFKNMPQEEVAKSPFSPILDIHEKQFINYFALEKGKYEIICFKEVFSKDHDFFKVFMTSLENYLESKFEEFRMTKKEIKKLLSS